MKTPQASSLTALTDTPDERIGQRVAHQRLHRDAYTFNDRHRIGLESYYYDVGKAYRPAYFDEEEGIMQNPAVAYRRTYMHHLTYEGATEDDRFFWNASYGISHDQYNSYSTPENKAA